MVWHGIVGIVALISALLHFVSPETVCKIDEIGKGVVISMEHLVRTHPQKLGLFYLLAGIFLVYIGFFRK